MKKVLVTTDFSTYSKAGMRFAIRLAAQNEAELVFFHCFQALIPTTIHRTRIDDAIQEQATIELLKLEKFAASLYKSMKINPGKYRCVVVEDLNPESAILNYAQQNGFSYICISTRGAGKLRKVIGTITGSIIVKSEVPVLAIPHTYRPRPIKKILYASDLEQIDKEMPVVSAFAKSIHTKFDLAHFYYHGEVKLDRKTLTEMWRKKYPLLDEVFLDPFDLNAGFAAQLDKLIHKVKPGIVVFFTHTNRSWFDKVFTTSRSEAFSFITKAPMLVCRK